MSPVDRDTSMPFRYVFSSYDQVSSLDGFEGIRFPAYLSNNHDRQIKMSSTITICKNDIETIFIFRKYAQGVVHRSAATDMELNLFKYCKNKLGEQMG